MDKRCKICGTIPRIILHERTSVKYYQCPECGFIQKEEAAFISPAKELAIYLTHENSLDKPDYVAYLKRFVNNSLIPFLGDKTAGLDFGSGPEPVLAQILRRDYQLQVDLYDYYFSPEKIYEGKTYDFIVSSEVVEHLQNPLPSFQLLASLLNKGGILSIMTLLHPDNDRLFQDWWYTRDKSHVSFYLEKTMSKIANITGMEMLYCDQNRYTTFRKT